MANARVTLPDGTTVSIEGTPDEVAAFIERLSPLESPAADVQRLRQPGSGSRQPRKQAPKTKAMGPIDYIRVLIGEDFFAQKRGLGEIKSKLDERAHFYPVTSLSPAVVRLVRKRELRRLKEDGTWKYVNS